MEKFFQLAPLEEKPQEERAANALMPHFLVQKKRYSETIVPSYDLVGLFALKCWIKIEIEAVRKERGLHFTNSALVERPGVIRHIKVMNQNQQMRPTGDIELPQFPAKNAIRCILSDYF